MYKYNPPMIIREHLRLNTPISEFKAQEPEICYTKIIFHYFANKHEFFFS